RFAAQGVLLEPNVLVVSEAQDRLERRKIERDGGLVRRDGDRPNPYSGLGLDHHAIAASQWECSGQVGEEMAGRLERDGDDLRQFLAIDKGIDRVRHYSSPLYSVSGTPLL